MVSRTVDLFPLHPELYLSVPELATSLPKNANNVSSVFIANTYYLIVSNLNLNSVNQLIFVMVKCGVLFEVRTEFLNNI
jgi:hypothetical protein